MGSQCQNESAVQAYLMPKLEIIVNTVLDHIKEENADAIEKIVYGGYSPEYYDRTGEVS